MRDELDYVKFYSPNDLSLSINFERSIELLDSFNETDEYQNINEIIELYNIYQIINSGGIKENFERIYKPMSSKLMKKINIFFKNINGDNLFKHYIDVNKKYKDDFWTLFEKFKVYEYVSGPIFIELIKTTETKLDMVLKHYEIVKHYNLFLAIYMRDSMQSPSIIIKKFLTKKLDLNKDDFSFPPSLQPTEYEPILQKYVDSDNPNISLLKTLAEARSSSECPLSDVLRLAAKRKMDFLLKDRTDTSSEVLSFTVCFVDNPDIVSILNNESFKSKFLYDINWVDKNTDYPTLLNNFIYLFEYVDNNCRCNFTSIKSQMGILESTLGVRGNNDYATSLKFYLLNAISSAQIHGYSEILLKHGIRIEDLIEWFFLDYLRNEFGVFGFTINVPSKGSTFLEKNKLLLSEMDGILRQFELYVSYKRIDRALLEISSKPLKFKDVPSLIERKYIYANSDDILIQQNLFFSDQNMLKYVPKYGGNYRNFYDLLKAHDIKKSDYPEWEVEKLIWLERKGIILFNDNDEIKINRMKVSILSSLFFHEVICPAYWKNQEEINNLITSGDLRYENSLFSKPEQDYLNYMLNKAEFSNGLDLRNKYMHSTYPVNEDQQKTDYYNILKILIFIVIKINEEFCLLDQKENIQVQ